MNKTEDDELDAQELTEEEIQQVTGGWDIVEPDYFIPEQITLFPNR